MANPIWFTAIGQFYVLGVDNCHPQQAKVPVTGTIRFTPMLANGDLIRATTACPNPAGIALVPVTGVIDEDGRVRLKKRPRHPECCECCKPGEEGVCLVGDSPLLELETPLFYEVSFHNIKFGNRPGSVASFVFQAPVEDGAVVDLITVMRVPGQLAAGVVAGPPGAPGKDGKDGVDGKDGADGADGADGVVDPSALEYIGRVEDDTEFVVVDPAMSRTAKAVKLSTWTVLKARLSDWLAGRDGPPLPGPGVQADLSYIPEIGRIRLPDPGFNDADILAGVPNPRRNPAVFNIIDGRTEFNETGHPFQSNPTPNPNVISFRHDLSTDSDARFILRARKGGTVLISENGTDLVAGVSHLVLVPVRGNAYVGANTGPVANHATPERQIVTAGNVVSLSNKTLVSPTITGNPVLNGNRLSSVVAVPASATAAGSPGQWAEDNDFLYVYVGDGTTHAWRRAALSTW